MFSFLPRRLRVLLLAATCLLATPAMAAEPPSPTDTLLGQMHQAYGGDAWADAGALVAHGSESADGLDGPLDAVVDLRTGYNATHTGNGVFESAYGCDADGCWHVGISGLVHAYDSAEAARTAITENWLGRFGFLFPQQLPAIYRALPDTLEDGKRYRRLEATPPGGHAITLWIDPATHRVDRAIWRESFLIASQRYADYRRVNGLMLPFRITATSSTLGGGSDGTSVDTIERYQVLAEAPAERLQRPDATVRNVTMAHGAARATSPMHLEGGMLLVEASINGKGPLPFILDTGGHAILTTDAAKQLGLASHGAGSSTGSGPGAMSTAYTRVAHLTIGDADIQDQTFLVMPYPYPFYERGLRTPVAGILGLEIFQRFAVTFDYDHDQLVLQPFDHGAAPPPGTGTALPIFFTDDMPLVDAAMDGRHGVFGVDTGNSGKLLVFPQWAAREGLFARYENGSPHPTGGVGGMYVSHVSHARSLQLGDARIDNPLIQLTRADAGATGNPTEAGNIGQDILSRFNVHFDYRRQRMYVAPRAQPRANNYATAGFAVAKLQEHPDRFVVGWVLDGGPAAQAGLKKGDFITAVNGTPARQLSGRELRDLSSGQPEGTRLQLQCADGRTVDVVLRDVAPK
jgi:hypothetical protein